MNLISYVLVGNFLGWIRTANSISWGQLWSQFRSSVFNWTTVILFWVVQDLSETWAERVWGYPLWFFPSGIFLISYAFKSPAFIVLAPQIRKLEKFCTWILANVEPASWTALSLNLNAKERGTFLYSSSSAHLQASCPSYQSQPASVCIPVYSGGCLLYDVQVLQMFSTGK